MDELQLLAAEGKTKRIVPGPPGTVDIVSKNDITAGDGAKHALLPDKAMHATQTTVNVFRLLQKAGIPTHYLAPVNSTTFRARRLRMVPLEVVIRRHADGSYLMRHPGTELGDRFDELVIEFYEKNGPLHDPLVIFGLEQGVLRRYRANVPEAEGFIDEAPLADSSLKRVDEAFLARVSSQARQIFSLLAAAWAGQGVDLYDLKLEFGFDAETGVLLLGDVVDNDSWRIWLDGERLDKQVFRELSDDPGAWTAGLLEIAANYAMVAQMSERFPEFRVQLQAG